MTNQEASEWYLARSEMLAKGFYWFAWRPVILEDGRWVWLERVHARVVDGFYGSSWKYSQLTDEGKE